MLVIHIIGLYNIIWIFQLLIFSPPLIDNIFDRKKPYSQTYITFYLFTYFYTLARTLISLQII